jgi:hypothetical protein
MYSVGSVTRSKPQSLDNLWHLWLQPYTHPRSSEDGNRSSFRNVVFFSILYNTWGWTMAKTPVIPNIIHHRQNRLKSTRCNGFADKYRRVCVRSRHNTQRTLCWASTVTYLFLVLTSRPYPNHLAARGSVDGTGIMLQSGRSRDRVPRRWNFQLT